MRNFLAAALTICIICARTPDLRADESYNGESPPAAQPPSHPEVGSDAQFDKRLPPVLPGEEVRDGKRVMKVWSTSGSVSVGQVPQAPVAPDPWGQNIGGVGVVVDQRSDHDRHGHK